MLTLAPGCSCDVCAEEYGPHRPPHSIPCGHVLCSNCCLTIVEKTSPRSSPACPFCREPFTSDSTRLIRMDFTTSGWNTPRRFPAMESFNDTFSTEVLQKKTERLLSSVGSSKARPEVRRLEEKVARVAAKKCSVEEVSSLYTELDTWLRSEKDDQISSLSLSAALLRAILMNHFAHSEASKAAKTAEANLKNKIDDVEAQKQQAETELRKQRTQFTEKSQECQQLRVEVNQLKALATTLGVATPDTQRTLSPTPAPVSPSPSPTPYSTNSSAQSPLSRFNSMHSRSASMSSRPTTPATPVTPTRSHTPAPSLSSRSHTPGPVPRSHTPGPTPPRSHTPAPTRSQTPAPNMPPRSHTPSLRTPSLRSYTPAPPIPSLPRFSTPAPTSMAHRVQTPAPLVPPKPRRLSQPPSPPKIMRSTSEEKAEAHERWLPPLSPEGESDYNQSSKLKSSRPASRTASYSISSRHRDY